MVNLPLPSVEHVAIAVVAFQAGAACPVYYYQERFRGFGRAMVDRLPYRPPPGRDEKEALQEAVEQGDDDEQRAE
jgi:cyclic lactone autoinducer peptide